MSDVQDIAISPNEAARMLGVSADSVIRWAKAKKLLSFKTVGGHHRFWRADVERLRAEMEAGVA